MRAMILEKTTDLGTTKEPLRLVDLPLPVPAAGMVRIRVLTCGVCHTELDEIEGRTAPPRFPVVPGHQVVGVVDAVGDGVGVDMIGRRVGVAWIFSACGQCSWCRQGLENLCPDFVASGRDVDGGYAEYMVAPIAFVHDIPEVLGDAETAPLLCAGAIGYRSLALANLGQGRGPLGLTGFGASAHLVLKLVRYQYPQLPVYVFARSEEEQQFARELGAEWSGATDAAPPQLMTAVIDTTPAWKPVLSALRYLAPGGRLVINAIRKESYDNQLLTQLDYPIHLWQEKEIKSVANVTRHDVKEFLRLAAEIPIHPVIEEFPLEKANQPLLELKERKIRGAKVLRVADR